nr:SDR family NAD(P)-dependent oxidoreductase [uncultured Roseateles sp.]
MHAVVTGGGSGIGAAIARGLLQDGYAVTLMGRNLAKLQAQQAELSTLGRVGMQTVDVADEAAVQAAFAASTAELGPIAVLVNNAGQAESAPLQRTSLALWQQMLSVNLTGTFLCSREVLTGMTERRQGRIINVASTAALKGYAYVAAYVAAKHGVLGLTRAMALELARKGITVNAVCPGYTETEIVDSAIARIVSKTGRTEEEARAELSAGNPQGRMVQPDEVAQAVRWLARAESSSITGQAIAVCGGEVM